MTESDRKIIEERLLEERDRTVRLLSRADENIRSGADDDGELSQIDQHPADEGTDTMEQEKTLMLLGHESELLTSINDALRRLYEEPDTFGKCENCGRDIDMQRLELLPWTVVCSECATNGGSAAA
jgi:DnaK suppressor protein